MTTQSRVTQDVSTIITNRILLQLEHGTVPWRQTWRTAGRPKNMVTGRYYRGINVLLLSSMGFTENIFLTLKQVNELGGSIKKGVHACPVVFWSQKDVAKANSEEKEVKRVLRYYNVFNIEQCLHIPENRMEELHFNDAEPILACDKLVVNMPLCPKIYHKGGEAYYDTKNDTVTMPRMKTFTDSESYYVTLYHELIHATGHEKRLGRESIMHPEKFASDGYGEEELVAQIGACFLASLSGCTMANFENDVAYIQHWMSRLRNDKRLLLSASSKAQQAVDFILNTSSVKDDIESSEEGN
jgi:antirestriction protein ArdC